MFRSKAYSERSGGNPPSRFKSWALDIQLDLDYFFWHDAEQLGLLVSDAYLETCFEKVREKIEDRTIAVTTIALSPEHGLTGGWEAAERLAIRI